MTGLIASLGVTRVHVAGGTGSVSESIAAALAALPGLQITRLAGDDRYLTSHVINVDGFTSPTKVYLAVGTSYPDALSGGALAGHDKAPLFVVPAACIPYNVIDSLRTMHPARIVLLGGSGGLSPSVDQLVECAGRP